MTGRDCDVCLNETTGSLDGSRDHRAQGLLLWTVASAVTPLESTVPESCLMERYLKAAELRRNFQIMYPIGPRNMVPILASNHHPNSLQKVANQFDRKIHSQC